MGEEDLLTTANKYADEFRNKVTTSYQIDKDNIAFLKSLLTDFNVYYEHAFALSKEMVDGTMDFDTLGDRSTQMAEQQWLTAKLNAFQSEKYKSFNNAFESVSGKSRIHVYGWDYLR